MKRPHSFYVFLRLSLTERGFMSYKKVFIETYGCQMNFSDSEIVASVLESDTFCMTGDIKDADVILMNTCSIRDHAEQRVFKRLEEIGHYRKKRKGLVIGVLGCMAERIRDGLIDDGMCDLVAGPDSYRDLPALIAAAETGSKAVNTLLSADETYSDIRPVRLASNGVSAFISIMRGCQNFCTYCVVPYTRGKERSRPLASIVREAGRLFENGYRELTLLGQNVNSYSYTDRGTETDFPQLMQHVASVSPDLRVRFATSHPKDLSDELLEVMMKNENLCRHIHLPMQSGSDRILQMMNRKYSSAYFIERVNAIRSALPDCSISTDIITGFCSETEDDHQITMDMMKSCAFDFAYMFRYSERPGTAAEKFPDDVPDKVKGRRLNEIIALQRELSLAGNRKDVGKVFKVLAEGTSKRSELNMSGRNSQNKMVVFPRGNTTPGEYVEVKITSCTSATLKGEPA
jgi:tRNA-2-methylthio-N6-dimethylallyladenosine synthase